MSDMSALSANASGAGTKCAPNTDFNLTQFDCISTYKVDAQIYLSMITNGILGVFCIIAFCFLQTFVSVYKGRLWSPQVAIKPPFDVKGGIIQFVYWLYPTIALTERELLATAGLDALMFERLIMLGLQFFLPVCVVSCAVLIPMHVKGGDLDLQESSVTPSTLMKLTMSNMQPKANELWVHFILLYAYCIYGMWLINHHYKWYVLLRQHYLTRGDSVVPWMDDNPKLSATLAEMSAADAKLLSEVRGEDTSGLQWIPQGAAGAAAMEPPRPQEMGKQQQENDAVASELLAATLAAQQQQQQQQQQSQPRRTSSPSESPSDSRQVSRQSSLQQLLPSHQARSSSSSSNAASSSSKQRRSSPTRDRQQQQHHGRSHPLGPTLEEHSSSSPYTSSPHWSAGSPTKGLTPSSPTTHRHREYHRSLSMVAVPRSAQKELEEQRQDAQVEASVAAAIETLGADQPWWAVQHGDPLLDRHVVHVDIAADTAWQKDATLGRLQSRRLYRWWELGPRTDDPGPVLERVPRTHLMFDHRSLRVRKPSVRFRNTIHVAAEEGQAVPLHISSYAVLVTNVPEVDDVALADQEELQDLDQGQGCSWVHKMMWSLPCMLSSRDLSTLACKWSSQVYQLARAQRSANSTLDPGPAQAIRALLQNSQGSRLPPAGGSRWAAGSSSAPHTEAGTSRQQQGGGGGRPSSSTNGAHQQQQGDEEDLEYSRRSTADSAVSAMVASASRLRLVEQTFKQLFPEDFHAVVPVFNFKPVDELLRQWNFDMQAYIQGRALLELRSRRAAQRAQRSHHAPQHAAYDPEQPPPPAAPAAAVQPHVASNGSSAGVSHHGNHNGSRSSADAAPTAAAAAVGQHPGSSSSNTPAATGPTQVQPKRGQPPGLSIGMPSDGGGDVEMGPLTPRAVPPLLPRVVSPDNVKVYHADVDEEEGACCAALLGPCLKEKLAPAEALERQRQALGDLEASILEAQRKVLSGPCTSSFMVLFKTPQAATLAASSAVFPQSSVRMDAFQVHPAPSPEDVLWQSLWKSPAYKRKALFKAIPLYMVLYAVPTGIFTAALNSIAYSVCNANTHVAEQMAWFCHTRFLQFLFTVVLPFVLLMLWQNMVIPQCLYKLELRRGAAVSLSQMERNILIGYCGWEVVNLFLGAVLSASLVSQIHILIDQPSEWMHTLGAAIPNSSNFFLNYVIMRAFLLNSFRLIMPHGGMWRWIGQMLFTVFTRVRHTATERYRAFIIYPASIRYGREPGLVLLILLIGMAYSIAAPLMTPFTLVYMLTAYIVWRYQMLYVCVRCYESGGKFWPLYCKIVMWFMAIFVIFTSCILILKQANIQGVLSWPLLLVLYLFNRWCHIKYSKRVESAPLWLAHEAPRTEIDPLVYVPPALQPHARGWYFEVGKAWVRWGVPPYVD